MKKENIETLTSEIIMKEIEKYRHEWERDGDWWWGISKPYKGVPVGYDVNIHQTSAEDPFTATVYQLRKDDNRDISIATDEVIFVFPVPTREELGR